MLPVVTAQQMQAIDRHAIDGFAIPGITLMENAGIGIIRELQRRFPDLSRKKVFIFCGKGNNGGDGFVIARHLLNMESEVTVLLAGKFSDLKGDAKTNADSARGIGTQATEIDADNLNRHDHKLRHCDIIIDAVFGTGLNKPATGFMEKVIDKINQFEKFVVSVDINSGVDSDSGQLMGPHVNSDLTLALACLKQSHLLHPSAGVMKEVQLIDIGIPVKACESQNIQVHQSEEEDIKSYFPKRDPNSHKGNYGHVLVLAGSRGKGGAAGLTALAVLRSGAGLCTLALPDSSQKAFEVHPMEVMTVALPETANGTLSLRAKDSILNLLKDKSALAIGPGISTDPETVALIGELLPQIQCPLVLDADALNALSLHKDWLGKLQPETVLTPHPKEMSRLTGVSTEEIQRARVATASKFASDHNLTLVLKGSPTLIGLADGSVVINPTGNAGMATGGSGDVLTGIIAGLIAQGLSPTQAAISGAYLHGQAGDHYAENESQTTLIAGDLLRCLPDSMKRILP